jgi:hypothetical protein
VLAVNMEWILDFTKEVINMKHEKYTPDTSKHAQAESGQPKDVKGVPHKDGRSNHMRFSNHEFGEYKTGSDHHDCHRGKS